MSGETRQHPGRSAEFLSRLHDGELEPGERAHFESHRAHCAECRRAAIEFENALAMFRSAGSRPPRPDLAGRILRKIQTPSRPRAPFSLRFRADLGWAALLLTGIFALLLTTVRRGEAPVVVSLPDRSADSPASAPSTAAVLQKGAESEPDSAGEAKPAPPPDRAAKPAAAPPAVAPGKEEKTTSLRSEESERRPAFVPEPGRMAGSPEAGSAGASTARPLRVSIEALDGLGSAPRLLSDEWLATPASYRGREFVVLVDAQGSVREVLPESGGEGAPRDSARLSTPAGLSELKFEPGDRPRRLRLRFE